MTSVKPRPSDAPPSQGTSEFDILKRNHKFLREEEHEDSKKGSKEDKSWDEALAQKFYSNLWKEYALCDLKHYKSGNFALRWRTEAEVVSGAGESTCGNTRCKNHDAESTRKSHIHSSSSSRRKKDSPALNTLELPFGYVENGQPKSALVKVVLCDKCVKKIMWKRQMERKEKESTTNLNDEEGGSSSEKEQGTYNHQSKGRRNLSTQRIAETIDDRDTSHHGQGRREEESAPGYRLHDQGNIEETGDRTGNRSKRKRSRSPGDRAVKHRRGSEGIRK